MKKKKIIITNRKRFTAFVAVCVLLVCMVCMTTFNKRTSVYAQGVSEVALVEVTRGDTLWSIAKQYKQENQDTRDMIDDIKEYNKLTSSSICVGDVLYIPNP